MNFQNKIHYVQRKEKKNKNETDKDICIFIYQNDICIFE